MKRAVMRVDNKVYWKELSPPHLTAIRDMVIDVVRNSEDRRFKINGLVGEVKQALLKIQGVKDVEEKDINTVIE